MCTSVTTFDKNQKPFSDPMTNNWGGGGGGGDIKKKCGNKSCTPYLKAGLGSVALNLLSVDDHLYNSVADLSTDIVTSQTNEV